MTNTEVAQPAYQSKLAKVNDLYMPMITRQLEGNDIEMSSYQKTVVLNAMTAISATLKDSGLTLKDVDSSNITSILLSVAALELNAAAEPREVYFITRRRKDKASNNYVQTIEMGIEGDGNDALLARFGRGVKTVHKFWAVREKDYFKYPQHKGLAMSEPEWKETGEGKVMRVVYPITFEDDSTEYFIGEREDVRKNLIAHVSQNLMWDKGTAREDFVKAIEDKTLDQILDEPELVKLGKISPAWASPQARESMIVRKMRNNVVKKIPKDFRNSFVASEYAQATDESYKAMRRDVTEQANTESFDAIAEQAAPQPAPVEHVEAPQPAQAVSEPAPVEESQPAPSEPEPSPEPQTGEADPF